MELEYSAPATGIVTTRIANRRVGSVMWCAFVTGLALSGLLVYLPLYTTKVLALSNAQYARLLALRMGGITVGVIVLGAISDRFGARRVTMICLAAGGALLACVGGASLGALLLLVPLISALLSTSFVNLNHLTQIADPSRQGRANTLYRAAGTLAGIVAPLIVTRFLGLGGWVMAAIGLLVASAAGVLASYPLHEPHRPIEGLVSEMRSLAGMYAAPLRSGGLMRFINLSILVTVLGA
ncbi:MAG TPA: MFS transporter, partial [Tepidisphaeraceae bacterium]